MAFIDQFFRLFEGNQFTPIAKGNVFGPIEFRAFQCCKQPKQRRADVELIAHTLFGVGSDQLIGDLWDRIFAQKLKVHIVPLARRSLRQVFAEEAVEDAFIAKGLDKSFRPLRNQRGVDANIEDIGRGHVDFPVHGAPVQQTQIPRRIAHFFVLDHDRDLSAHGVHQFKKIVLVHVGFLENTALSWGVQAEGPSVHIVGEEVFFRGINTGRNGELGEVIPVDGVVSQIVYDGTALLRPDFLNISEVQMNHIFHSLHPFFYFTIL